MPSSGLMGHGANFVCLLPLMLCIVVSKIMQQEFDIDCRRGHQLDCLLGLVLYATLLAYSSPLLSLFAPGFPCSLYYGENTMLSVGEVINSIKCWDWCCMPLCRLICHLFLLLCPPGFPYLFDNRFCTPSYCLCPAPCHSCYYFILFECV